MFTVAVVSRPTSVEPQARKEEDFGLETKATFKSELSDR